MKLVGVIVLLLATLPSAQSAAARHKQLLAIGEQKGYRHEAVSHALATIERLGHESCVWDTTIRTDTEALSKKKLEFNAKNLNDFDAVLFFTGGELEMDAEAAEAEVRLSLFHFTMTARVSSASIAPPSLSRTGPSTER
jgi:hypothetical protein